MRVWIVYNGLMRQTYNNPNESYRVDSDDTEMAYMFWLISEHEQTPHDALLRHLVDEVKEQRPDVWDFANGCHMAWYRFELENSVGGHRSMVVKYPVDCNLVSPLAKQLFYLHGRTVEGHYRHEDYKLVQFRHILDIKDYVK